ncbi:MAG: alpha/beta fold hydrolase [Pseudomonadota bacterium]
MSRVQRVRFLLFLFSLFVSGLVTACAASRLPPPGDGEFGAPGKPTWDLKYVPKPKQAVSPVADLSSDDGKAVESGCPSDRATPSLMNMADGARLPACLWSAEKTAQMSVSTGPLIIAFHGFNDYGFGFDIPATRWAQFGIATLAVDQRGFGAAPFAGYWPGGQALAEDACTVVRLARDRYPNRSIFVLGESMGAAVAIHSLANDEECQSSVDGAILVAPAAWGKGQLNIFYRAALWFSSTFMPNLKLTGESLERWPTDNRDVMIQRAYDPLVIYQTRVSSVNGIVSLMTEAQENAGRLSLPLLVVFGGNDQIIPAHSVAALRDNLNVHDYAYLPEAYHMLFRDRAGHIASDEVARWVLSQPRPAVSFSEESEHTASVVVDDKDP